MVTTRSGRRSGLDRKHARRIPRAPPLPNVQLPVYGAPGGFYRVKTQSTNRPLRKTKTRVAKIDKRAYKAQKRRQKIRNCKGKKIWVKGYWKCKSLKMGKSTYKRKVKMLSRALPTSRAIWGTWRP